MPPPNAATVGPWVASYRFGERHRAFLRIDSDLYLPGWQRTWKFLGWVISIILVAAAIEMHRQGSRSAGDRFQLRVLGLRQPEFIPLGGEEPHVCTTVISNYRQVQQQGQP